MAEYEAEIAFLHYADLDYKICRTFAASLGKAALLWCEKRTNTKKVAKKNFRSKKIDFRRKGGQGSPAF